jgi:hypothetical protein
VGGEYGAGWKSVGAGRLVTTFFGDVSSVVDCGAVQCGAILTCLTSKNSRILDIYLFIPLSVSLSVSFFLCCLFHHLINLSTILLIYFYFLYDTRTGLPQFFAMTECSKMQTT